MTRFSVHLFFGYTGPNNLTCRRAKREIFLRRALFPIFPHPPSDTPLLSCDLLVAAQERGWG